MKHAIGIDLGGTKIEGVIAGDDGNIIYSVRGMTESNKSREVVVDNIYTVINKLLNEGEKKGLSIAGIGIGVPGPVPPGNKLTMLPNISCLEGINLQSQIKNKFGKKVVCDNDANCFALAEAMYGAGKNNKVVAGIIWGTGIGGGIVINKKVYSGAGGLAGELGHTVVKPDAKVKCGCGHYGDIESFCSAPNLVKYYQLYGGKNKNADSKYIMACKDSVAKKVAEQAINYLSMCIAFTVNLLNADVIVLGGGISNSSHYKRINQVTDMYVAPALRDTYKIVKHKIGDSAGVLGAAGLVL